MSISHWPLPSHTGRMWSTCQNCNRIHNTDYTQSPEVVYITLAAAFPHWTDVIHVPKLKYRIHNTVKTDNTQFQMPKVTQKIHKAVNARKLLQMNNSNIITKTVKLTVDFISVILGIQVSSVSIKMGIDILNIVAAFCGMHVSPANIAMCDYQESVTTRQTDRQMDGQTDRRQTKWSLYVAMLRRQHKNTQVNQVNKGYTWPDTGCLTIRSFCPGCQSGELAQVIRSIKV